MTELRSALHDQLTLSRAHAAAYAGDLDLAMSLLGSIPPTVASLDLKARVHAQRGEFSTADSCWIQVLSMESSDPDAKAGREAIARIIAGGRARPLVNAAQAAVVAAAVVATAVVGGVVWLSSSDRAPAAAAPIPPQAHQDSNPLQAQVDELRQRLSAVDSERTAAAARHQQALDTLAARFAGIPGVRVERRADDVRLVFEAGVFWTEAEITTAARPLLTEIGARLADAHASVTIVGHAVAVAGGRTSGGSTVALARAQVAAGYLATGGKLPLTAFKLATADQSEGPFPDAPRNRTVTILLSVPAGESK
ncbi:hypothetical protein [Actinocrispum sp. NPDC049592]|uniref:hypothetical protein n=1 Tax=Actinocrispum sp. NPDC049592 TaxID=3154835 RepID=UPI003418D810